MKRFRWVLFALLSSACSMRPYAVSAFSERDSCPANRLAGATVEKHPINPSARESVLARLGL